MKTEGKIKNLNEMDLDTLMAVFARESELLDEMEVAVRANDNERVVAIARQIVLGDRKELARK